MNQPDPKPSRPLFPPLRVEWAELDGIGHDMRGPSPVPMTLEDFTAAKLAELAARKNAPHKKKK